MSRLHIQANAPSIEDSMLPAYGTAKVNGQEVSVILWNSYINHRNSAVVYLSSCEGRCIMVPETNIKLKTVRSFN